MRDCDFPVSVLQTISSRSHKLQRFQRRRMRQTDRRTDGQIARRIAVGGQGRLTPLQLWVGDQPPTSDTVRQT